MSSYTVPVIYIVEFMVAVSPTFSLHALLQGGNQPHIQHDYYTTILLYCTNYITYYTTILYIAILLYYTILRTVILIWTSISGRLFSGQQKWWVKHHGDSLIHCFTVIRGAISWNSTPVELGGLSYCKILVTGASTSQAEDFFHQQQHVFRVYLHSTMPVESETKQNSPPNYKWT